MTIPRPVPSACSATQTEKMPSTGPEPANRSVSGGPPAHHGQSIGSGSGGTGTAKIASTGAVPHPAGPLVYGYADTTAMGTRFSRAVAVSATREFEPLIDG